jgi:hypothetical protein
MQDHPAAKFNTKKKVIFTAFSKNVFYMRTQISKFVLEKSLVPINPFLNYDYFLSDTVDRDLVRAANNSLIHVSDELWTFGSVSDGVLVEIKLAQKLNKPVQHFSIQSTYASILPISSTELNYEDNCLEFV